MMQKHGDMRSFFGKLFSDHQHTDHNQHNASIADLLLDNLRRSPGSINTKYLSPLEKAIFTGECRLLKKELIKGDVNKISIKYGFTAVHYAVELGSLLIVRELFISSDGNNAKRKSFANPEILDIHGRSPLMIVNFLLLTNSLLFTDMAISLGFY